MNASPYHPKVRVSLSLPHAPVVAGEDVVGSFEIECRTDKILGMGAIIAELFATEGTFITEREACDDWCCTGLQS